MEVVSLSRVWLSSSGVSVPCVGVGAGVDGKVEAEDEVGAMPRTSEIAEADLEERRLEAMYRAL